VLRQNQARPLRASLVNSCSLQRYLTIRDFVPVLLGERGRHFADNQRFISAAMRSRPASPSASLRRCPNGILRASRSLPSLGHPNHRFVPIGRTLV
jgi:hypothetical protein